MADPVTMAMVGAGLGAATSDDPLKGALLGGVGGFAGGSFLGGAGGLTAGTGLTAGGQQAAMLAAQNSGMGAGATMATNAALASNPALNPGLLAGAYQGATDLAFGLDSLPGNPSSMISAGNNLMGKEQPQPVVSAPPPMMPQRQPQSFQASVLPATNNANPRDTQWMSDTAGFINPYAYDPTKRWRY